jgi:hypothetical protein
VDLWPTPTGAQKLNFFQCMFVHTSTVPPERWAFGAENIISPAGPEGPSCPPGPGRRPPIPPVDPPLPCVILYGLHVLLWRHTREWAGLFKKPNKHNNNKSLKINKCPKCGRGRCCVASASVRRRTAVSEWISWTLPSCPSGGSANSAPISYQKSQKLRK